MLTRLLGGLAMTVVTAGFAVSQTIPPAPLPKAKPARPAKPAPAKEVAPPAKPGATPRNTVPGIDLPKTPDGAPATSSSSLLTDCPSPCNPCTPCCVPCGPPGKFWIDGGFLWWTTSGQNTPALVSTAPVGTPRPQAGALGQPNTSVLYPTSATNDDWRGGVYLNVGMWFNCSQTCGFETNFFYLGQSNDGIQAGSNGSAIITRPFYNNTLGIQDTELVSFPGVLSGTVNVDSTTDVWGINPNAIWNCCCGPCGRFDTLLGFYYLNLTDELVINENLTSLPGQLNVAPGTQFLIQDAFRTTNNFYGFNLGFAFERRFSYWYAGLRAGCAIGWNHQTVEISGSTTIIPPRGTPSTFAGGLLTQPSNIGTYERDEFAVLPWVGLKLGAQVTQRLRVYVGYDYMYLSNVVRAGEQIDTRVNTTQLPPRTSPVVGPLVPAFNWNDTGFHMHGIRIGAEFRF